MPLPLAMAPIVTVVPSLIGISTAICFGLVSVVMIAFAASRPASSVSESFPDSALTPAFTFSIGSCIPITPVEPTRVELSSKPKAASADFAVSLQ